MFFFSLGDIPNIPSLPNFNEHARRLMQYSESLARNIQLLNSNRTSVRSQNQGERDREEREAPSPERFRAQQRIVICNILNYIRNLYTHIEILLNMYKTHYNPRNVQQEDRPVDREPTPANEENDGEQSENGYWLLEENSYSDSDHESQNEGNQRRTSRWIQLDNSNRRNENGFHNSQEQNR